jgi:hypothetical protein
VGAEIVDLVRAACGGLLFGIPLLYTMKMWWVGSHTTATQTLVVLSDARGLRVDAHRRHM